jgi:hypothetical protein
MFVLGFLETGRIMILRYNVLGGNSTEEYYDNSVFMLGGHEMHTPMYRINNGSRGRWRDRSVGSGGCTRLGFGNR